VNRPIMVCLREDICAVVQYSVVVEERVPLKLCQKTFTLSLADVYHMRVTS
jgi:hypothetical protein